MSPACRFVLAALLAVGCNAPTEIDDISYDDRYGSATTIDFYLPDNDELLRPTVMFIHGGGWVGGDKNHALNIGPRLARSGYVVASINYRLVPAGVFPNNATDCFCALAFLRVHADEYGIDPDRIAVVGYSAGAHLGGLVGLASDHPELPADCEAPVLESELEEARRARHLGAVREDAGLAGGDVAPAEVEGDAADGARGAARRGKLGTGEAPARDDAGAAQRQGRWAEGQAAVAQRELEGVGGRGASGPWADLASRRVAPGHSECQAADLDSTRHV